MKISDLQLGEILTVELRCADKSPFGEGLRPESEAFIYPSTAATDVCLSIGNEVWPIQGSDAYNQSVLSSFLRKELAYLGWLVGTSPKQGPAERITVQLHSFRAKFSLPEQIEIGVDERIIESIEKSHLRRSLSSQDAIEWLSGKLLITTLPRTRAIISSGPRPDPRMPTAFRLHGHGIAINVERSNQGILCITRVVSERKPRNDEQTPLQIVEGDFRFVDHTVAGQFRGTAQNLLDAITRAYDSYLASWHQYNQIESSNILRQARELGWLPYYARTQSPDGVWRFQILLTETSTQVLRRFSQEESLALEAAIGLPAVFEKEPEASSEWADDGRGGGPHVFVGECVQVDWDRNTLDLRPLDRDAESPPPEHGVLFVSLRGDQVRLERRERARNRIQSAACPMPQLGLILEGRPVVVSHHRHIPASNSALRVIRSTFQTQPSSRQLEAIEIALNTPDIALVQGPPGTGKTLVVTAIEACLAEESEETNPVAGQTLLTSYQHEAVENAAGKTMVLGLPAIKVGSRGRSSHSEFRPNENIERWRDDRVRDITEDLERRPDSRLSQELRWMRQIHTAYTLNPGPNNETATLVSEVWDRVKWFVSSDLADQLCEMSQRLNSWTMPTPADHPDMDSLLRAIRSLRTDPDGFADDGAITAYKLLIRLEGAGLLSETARELLDRASNWVEDTAPDFLTKLRVLKEELTDRLNEAPREATHSNLLNADVEALLTRVVDELEHRLRTSRDGMDAVLYDYLQSLAGDPIGVRKAIQDYTSVLAATCQQAVGREMESLKEEVIFESVIVDEAARANPLDLMIPLAQARRRIVLVGDHRQLPHILEPDVERQLESAARETRELLGESLFQRLFRQLQMRETEDGIKRTITLNEQYRMHPVLGGFVSTTFYPPEEQFSSPLTAEMFQHGLPGYEGRVAAWVDMPYVMGGEQGERSRFRPAEAKWIAKEIKRLMASDQSGLTFGIVTFYKAQEQCLLRELREQGLAEEVEGEIQLLTHYLVPKERLRVGTVDAFQGREFDVVFLSMTRCNRLAAVDAASAKRKYGFLTLENRLCVAMSRQKRLLVVVGDNAMVQSPADQWIYGLSRFYSLFGGADGV